MLTVAAGRFIPTTKEEKRNEAFRLFLCFFFPSRFCCSFFCLTNQANRYICWLYIHTNKPSCPSRCQCKTISLSTKETASFSVFLFLFLYFYLSLLCGVLSSERDRQNKKERRRHTKTNERRFLLSESGQSLRNKTQGYIWRLITLVS